MNDAVQWYMTAFRKFAQFSGRSQRAEFWYFFLGNFVVSFVLALLRAIVGQNFLGTIFGGLSALFSLAVIIPNIAVGLRRLHDTGRSGWWWLLIFVPFGVFVVIYFWAQDSQPGDNQYGPNPKGLFA